MKTSLLPLAEYAIEAFLVGAFMLSACLFTALLEHPGSAVKHAVPDPFTRRVLVGAAMGVTAVCLIYSPWGRRSGAHFNPSVTLTHLRLRRISGRDALAYIASQCAGGIAGVGLAAAVAPGGAAAHPAVAFAVTVPGAAGVGIAFAAELLISFGLMAVILLLGDSRLAPFTGVVCGLLVAVFIAFEAPYSGMSMNPARSLSSAVFAGRWDSFWVYLIAPPLGMLCAAELHLTRRGVSERRCTTAGNSGAEALEV